MPLNTPFGYDAHMVASMADESAGYGGFMFKYISNQIIVKIWNGVNEFRIERPTPTYNTWNHYCVIYQRGNYLKLYKNGLYDSSNVVYSGFRNSGNPDIYFGGPVGKKGRFEIDEFAAWETELSPTEINDIYSSY